MQRQDHAGPPAPPGRITANQDEGTYGADMLAVVIGIGVATALAYAFAGD